MKRSTINRAMQWADTYLRANNIHLPEYAYWPLETWKDSASRLETIRKVMLGWDVTDFGMDDFDHIGAVLYTCLLYTSCRSSRSAIPWAARAM